MSLELPRSSSDFKKAILSQSIFSLQTNRFRDNFDIERFNYDGIDRSGLLNTSQRAFWFDWFFGNYQSLYSAFCLFNTDRSRRLYLNLLTFRLAGHQSVRIETRFDEKGSEYQEYKSTETYSESRISTDGMFGKLRHYDFIWKERRYIADCLGLKYYLFRKQYFLNDDQAQILPVESDLVIDAGACLGDTAIVFGKAVGKNGKVFAFDPVDNHLEVLKWNIDQNPDCNIEAMPFGLSNYNVHCRPVKLLQYSPGFKSQPEDVPLRTVDSLVAQGAISKIDYIKMDIEGAELLALYGSEESIRTFRPKLALSIYHKPNDLFEIPLYIAKEFPFYRLFIEHYTIHNEETVLYCTPR
jgi:FkbM family methyltransferase